VLVEEDARIIDARARGHRDDDSAPRLAYAQREAARRVMPAHLDWNADALYLQGNCL
jgi:hypothetical protein